MKKTKKQATGKYFFTQIVLDVHWFNWNDIKRTGLWNFNHKLQDLISKMALELLKNSKPINWDKFFKIAARLPYFFRQNCTLFVFYLSFFLLWIFEYFFFLLFSNTLKNTNPEFQNFPVSKSIAIRKNSKHVFRKNRGILTGMKTELRTSKDIMENDV